MHLADFIESHLDLLVADWISFARRLTDDSQDLSDDELKDLAAQLMLAIAADLRAPHLNIGRIATLHAGRFAGPATISRVARGHAEERHRHGFTLDQMVAEFRAMRVSVTRRWTTHAEDNLATTLDELVRFNEALDQALSESIAHYTTQLSRTRDMFAGVIAHDLRSPVQAIAMSAQALRQVRMNPDTTLKLLGRIEVACTRLRLLINDVLDFARTRLGDILPMNLQPASFRDIVLRAIDEVSASTPGLRIRKQLGDDNAMGCFDEQRLTQVVVNLLMNAVQHGDARAEIAVDLGREDDGFALAVSNHGQTLPPDVLATVFDPLRRGAQDASAARVGKGVGLGLYIVREIVRAHGGRVEMQSGDGVTTVRFWLPADDARVSPPPFLPPLPETPASEPEF
ncbi:sensor histidine kinase [Paraburkholderia phymatum]|uniref:Sensor histidine kinase n=2 Tax=Paraburkholderia phymatum TaxID=148447 RepID=A0ACC6UCN8_9BURK